MRKLKLAHKVGGDGSLTLVFSVKGLSNGLRNIQYVALLLIQTFSGMRYWESLSLPFDCLDNFEQDSRSHFIINGYTTKFNHGRRKKTQWVSNSVGARAILTAKKIADCINKAVNITPVTDIEIKSDLNLFISTSYLMINGERPFQKDGTDTVTRISTDCVKPLLKRILPTINEKDLNELERIDPFRSWRNESKFGIGESWPLTSHQLRRSLALYASRSGFVSLPSLRRQLQHITEEMTRYYASGSIFANHFIDDNKAHFGFEYREAQSESQFLSYLANVLLSDERLFGGHGQWIETHTSKSENIILTQRTETLQKFKRGEIAYKETMLGGCVKIGSCDKRALRWIPACISCKDSVGKRSKLQRVIVAQNKLLEKLDSSSVEWHSDKSDLDALIAVNELLERKNSLGI